MWIILRAIIQPTIGNELELLLENYSRRERLSDRRCDLEPQPYVVVELNHCQEMTKQKESLGIKCPNFSLASASSASSTQLKIRGHGRADDAVSP